MTTSKPADLAMAGLLVGLASVIGWESRRWPPATDFAGDPTILPRCLAALMVATAMALAVGAWRAHQIDRAQPQGGTAVEPARAWVGVAAAVAFAATLQPLGLICASIPLLVVLQLLAGAPWRMAVPAALMAPVLVWLILRWASTFRCRQDCSHHC